MKFSQALQGTPTPPSGRRPTLDVLTHLPLKIRTYCAHRSL